MSRKVILAVLHTAFLLGCLNLSSPMARSQQLPAGANPNSANSIPSTSTSANAIGNASSGGNSQPNLPAAATTASPTAAPAAMPTIENLKNPGNGSSGPAASRPLGKIELPSTSGQYWVEYDLKPYTQNLKSIDRPQQALIDWIIRETGSDVWFNEPMGILHADRTSLKVYHNAGMQQVVGQIYERFVNGNNDPQVFGIRLLAVTNPNWRTRALPLMTSAPVKSPGVHAWLMSKENAAIFYAQMRERPDAKDIQSIDLTMVQGQTQVLEQLRSRNYLREYSRNTASAWPPYTPTYDELQEGYKLVFSPLLSLDSRSMDVMLKCDIDQVEKLTPVSIDLAVAGQTQTAQIEVPQLVSWRLHERFRWPTDHVMVLSCGIVAAPTGQVNNTLLGGGAPNILGLSRILPNVAGQRSDAILILEHKGSAKSQIPALPTARAPGTIGAPAINNAAAGVSRGRY